jgi:transcriptional regulator with XRE-family HTH domain
MAKAKVSTNTLGSYLQEKRASVGLSQSDVADLFGYSTPQFISNWERGVSDPPVTAFKKLAQIYKASADELFEIFLANKVQDVTRDLRRRFNGR